VLGWKQKQAAEGHRSIGLTDLEIRKVSLEGLSEKEICEKIVAEKLGWKQVKAIAHIVNVAAGSSRGNTVRRAAEVLSLPYTEVNVEQFTDVYQVQRTLKAILEAQPFREKGSMIEKIMQTELLVSPY
jgi:hypothetical protein